MSDIVTPADLGVYLGQNIDPTDPRAQMLIDDAISQALSIVTVGDVPDTGPTEANLPAGADAVIRAAVARIWLNPAGVSQETTGPFTYSRSTGTGSMFSKAEVGTLRQLAGRGGAFTIDTLPDGYAPQLSWWDWDTPSQPGCF